MEIFSVELAAFVRAREQGRCLQPQLSGRCASGETDCTDCTDGAIDLLGVNAFRLPDLGLEEKAIAFARQISDRAVHAAVAERGAQRTHRPLQRVVGDRHIRPDGFEEFFLGDDPLAVSNQIDQQIEHTRLQWDLLARAQQHASSFIKLEQSK
ncbi:hypothetical protein ABIF05_002756 [Bradyrhizobium elkanii]